MATSDGKAIDELERGWDLPDGYELLSAEDTRHVRALLAADRSPGKEKALSALRASAVELDALTVHGAPSALAARVRGTLLAIRAAAGAPPPAFDVREAFRPHPGAGAIQVPEEPGTKVVVRARQKVAGKVEIESVTTVPPHRDPGPAPEKESRAAYLRRRAGG